MATPELTRRHVCRTGTDAKGVRFVVTSTDEDGNYDGDDPQFVLLLSACGGWPAGVVVSRTYLRAPIEWDARTTAPPPLPSTKPMNVTGAYVTRCMRGGSESMRAAIAATFSLTTEQIEAITSCRAEIRGDSDTGFVYHEEG